MIFPVLHKGKIEGFVVALCVCVSPSALGIRIVSTSPQATEILFQLGKGPDIVATSDFSNYPEQAKNLKRIGSPFMPSIERLVVFSPSHVIADDSLLTGSFEAGLLILKVPFFRLNIYSLDTLVEESYRLLRDLYKEFQNEYVRCYDRWLKELPAPTTQWTFIAFAWLSPPIVFGSKTLLSDLLGRFGGKNIVPQEWNIAFPQVSEEWLIQKKVDRAYYLRELKQSDKQMQRFLSRLFPKKMPKVIALPSDKFARSSFTPLHHMDALSVPPIPTAEKCRAYAK